MDRATTSFDTLSVKCFLYPVSKDCDGVSTCVIYTIRGGPRGEKRGWYVICDNGSWFGLRVMVGRARR